MTSDNQGSGGRQPAGGVPNGAAGGAGQRIAEARFGIGDIVRHRIFPFRGVIFDVDPEFANTEEWWEAIPEDVRPAKDQPFYHLLAENEDNAYVAYVSEQNLLPDSSGEPLDHPEVPEMFGEFSDGRYPLQFGLN